MKNGGKRGHLFGGFSGVEEEEERPPPKSAKRLIVLPDIPMGVASALFIGGALEDPMTLRRGRGRELSPGQKIQRTSSPCRGRGRRRRVRRESGTTGRPVTKNAPTPSGILTRRTPTGSLKSAAASSADRLLGFEFLPPVCRTEGQIDRTPAPRATPAPGAPRRGGIRSEVTGAPCSPRRRRSRAAVHRMTRIRTTTCQSPASSREHERTAPDRSPTTTCHRRPPREVRRGRPEEEDGDDRPVEARGGREGRRRKSRGRENGGERKRRAAVGRVARGRYGVVQRRRRRARGGRRRSLRRRTILPPVRARRTMRPKGQVPGSAPHAARGSAYGGERREQRARRARGSAARVRHVRGGERGQAPPHAAATRARVGKHAEPGEGLARRPGPAPATPTDDD